MEFFILFYYTRWVLAVPGFINIGRNQKDVRYLQTNLALYVSFNEQKFLLQMNLPCLVILRNYFLFQNPKEILLHFLLEVLKLCNHV